MTIAERIRQFFTDLFGPRTNTLYIAELKSRVAKAEQLADYFRDKADRLELRLIPPPVVRGVRSPEDMKPVGRKSWKQVQADNADKIRKEAEAEASKGPN